MGLRPATRTRPSGTGSIGIGFAVPVDIVRRVVPQLIRTGKVERPGLGIRTVDDRITHRMGLEGVLVEKVLPESAAAKAGLRSMIREKDLSGDLITAIDGQEVRNHDDLYRVLDIREIGETVKVTVMREGKPVELSVKLQPLPTVSP